ncbi:MAG: hypothetical protein RI932_895 [Pseudomonadota bacterium]
MSTMPETQHYAFFDVDGTVIARDSFRILMREMLLKGTRWRMALAALLCLLIAPLRLIGLADKTQFKSAFLWSATVGRSLRESLTLLKRIVEEQISPLWFVEMEAELDQLRQSGHKICYVSASGEPWLRFLLKRHDPNEKIIVGSKLMPFLGGMTLRGANCLGAEKIRRLRKILPGNIVWSVAYSDHRADLPLLLASKKRVVVNPTQKNRTAFLKHLGEQGFTEVSWSPLTAQNLKK